MDLVDDLVEFVNAASPHLILESIPGPDGVRRFTLTSIWNNEEMEVEFRD